MTGTTNACSGTATASVTIYDAPPTPLLSVSPRVTQPILQNTPYVTLTVTGCEGGTMSWQGPGGASGSGTTISVPTSTTGNLAYSATCQVGSCVSSPGTLTVTISPPLVSGSFDGFVNGADCSTFRGWAWDRNKGNTAISVDILDGPQVIHTLLADVFRQDLQTAGKGNGKHAFSWSIPTELKDGLAHNLTARVSGSSFILKDSPKALICQGSSTPANKAPVPPSPTILVTPLAAQVGVPFSGTLVAFTDPENQPLTYGLSGLPAGLSINANSRVISGTPTESGTFVLAYSASDGVLTNSVSFPLTVNPSSTTTVTGSFEGYLDKLDCGGIRGWVWDRNKPNTPLTVEFYRDGTGEVLGSAVANIFRQDLKDAGKGNGAHAYNFTPPGSVTSSTLIKARVLGSTYELKGGAKAYQCAPARLSAETGSELRVTVLGNPVSDQLQVEVRGAEGQPLRLQLTDLNGRLVTERQIETAKAIEQQSLLIGQHPAGLLLLRVSSGAQRVTLKVLKP
ncbi:putative Ig domain-containing protein [Larkinella humicola]|uniref:T9SS type A sorting domain-containing protein n=1 Tax=Larkinella humicola TaxID=2607654 RepID=A0A5N1JBK4_9BACT|nr:putative Ig domain-containing protein [Larkinella humicola]KAA9346406.1 T9SS type A sorting domain-containing protein [Larkinella humicola]